MAFAFSSCKDDNIKEEQSSTSTSTTEKENTTQEEPTKSDETTGKSDKSLVGEWVYNEIVSPQNFYTDFYNAEITKTNIKMRTTYKFNSDGTFSVGISIVNISEVRKEYRSLVVEAGRVKIESQGGMLTPENVLSYEAYADEILKEICTAQEGKYTVDGNKIVYTINGKSHYETFTLDGNRLTLTGSSNSNEGYPVKLTKN